MLQRPKRTLAACNEAELSTSGRWRQAKFAPLEAQAELPARLEKSFGQSPRSARGTCAKAACALLSESLGLALIGGVFLMPLQNESVSCLSERSSRWLPWRTEPV